MEIDLGGNKSIEIERTVMTPSPIQLPHGLNCCSLFFKSIIFNKSGRIDFVIDVVHNIFLVRIDSIPITFFANSFVLDMNSVKRFGNLLNICDIEPGQNIDVKFMDSDVRQKLEPIIKDFFYEKFKVVKDNGIILTLARNNENQFAFSASDGKPIDTDTGFPLKMQ